MRWLYTWAIRLYGAGIRLAALRSGKAHDWTEGRKNWKTALASLLAGRGSVPLLWVHVASMGEYEQAAPLIEAYRNTHPGHRILVSFFSPSGYKHFAKKKIADYIVYLPLDTPGNARYFVETVRPDKVIFIKYEYWFNFIGEIVGRKIPLYFVSSRFRVGQYFFRFYGRWFLNRLRSVSAFFVQDGESVELLRAKGIGQVFRSGDTRFDRVLDLVSAPADYPIVERFCQGRTVLMAGSSWPEDEKVILPYLRRHPSGPALVLVPHELDTHRLDALAVSLQGLSYAFYSQIERGNAQAWEQARVLVVDKMGMLSRLYRYADMAYIGGGFGKGIHNVLEAAVYSVPVLFGPNCRKFGEALGLLACGGGFCIGNESEFSEKADWLQIPSQREKAAMAAGAYVKENSGAVRIISELVFRDAGTC